ncbi:PD40 domain-containing protein [Geofilum rubicundum]|uniref:Uncharacterized protein n=1 Tax=Geofilum rubicundum JCM 15548 TaxID=1236989 RepID=A0A0E9LZU9_9BACT|nr:PD40 domain-containing protein [Geofilum rubicundum]GAO30375.1 hypothetical protein JCM15548_12640 [Geofilum rubicundum JCM 15548]
MPIYEKLLERKNRDADYNYYYGVSLFKLNQSYDEAIQRLKIAASRPPEADVHFYLGQLYQRVYETQLAEEQYQLFLKKQKGNNEMTDRAKRAIEDCQAAERLINKHFNIEVIQKDTIDKADLLTYYHLSKDAGKLLTAGEFFSVGVHPDQIVFRTERSNEVFFPLLGSSGKYDLYKIVRLLDAWTEAEFLEGSINSDYNDLYPFMLTDGTTIYFSSDRPGGMGGLDIYQSFFDPQSGTFSEPANLGPPFNSPDDDYLLVPDIYAGRAWFATNRGVGSERLVIAEIVWDDQVIRNLTQNVHQIKTLAALPVSENALPRASSTLSSRNAPKKERKTELFRFQVSDTLVYTQFEHFQSKEALSAFRDGFTISQKRDSLTLLMGNKRKAYSQSYNQQELKQLIEQIVALEKQTYGLEESINSHYQKARRMELDHIRQQIREGRYAPKTSTQKMPDQPTELQTILANLKKGELSFYTDAEFQRKMEERAPMYRTLFNPSQIAELQRADSLSVWANILSLESARLLEESRNITTQPVNLKDRITNGSDIEEEMSQQMEDLIHQSREYKRNSLILYEQALDHKYRLYYERALALGASSNQAGSEELASHARTRYNEADESIKRLQTYHPEQLERLLALKRQSNEMLEESLNIQMAGTAQAMVTSPASQTGTRFTDISGSVAPSYPAIHKNEAGVATGQPARRDETPSDIVAGAFATAQPGTGQTEPATTQTPMPLEYRIQIGVFRNEPNAAALANIPQISSEALPDKPLRKYFSGSWPAYETAKSQVENIREAGFPGAFVVAFFNGQQISLEEARKKE